ncbi:unnamed protein product [Moneuplotes crassus]|uniref:Uncharacterized protein n=1 Tax=Euplotes crassus TaxID=5936 RepID=A0AAD2D286_EUPCR|nr:unnamed protein product [Moneuplotes crassus]
MCSLPLDENIQFEVLNEGTRNSRPIPMFLRSKNNLVANKGNPSEKVKAKWLEEIKIEELQRDRPIINQNDESEELSVKISEQEDSVSNASNCSNILELCKVLRKKGNRSGKTLLVSSMSKPLPSSTRYFN